VRLNAIDSGFHVVPAGRSDAHPDADGDSVANVRLPKGLGYQDRGYHGTQLVLWTCNGGTNQHWTLP
jgi:hypothetical protein